MLGIVIASYIEREEFLYDTLKSFSSLSIPHKIVVVRTDKSMAENMNIGIKHFLTDEEISYIKIFANDDLIIPNALEEQYHYMKENTSIDFCHSQAVIFYYPSMKEIIYKPEKETFTLDELNERNYISGGSVIYKKEIFNNILLDESLPTCEEYELNLNILSNGYTIGYFSKPTYKYRRWDKNKSLGKEADQTERNKIKQQIYDNYRNSNNE